MSPTMMAQDFLWSLPLVVGLARIASAVMDWPHVLPADPGVRARSLSHLVPRVSRVAFGASLVTLSMAAFFRRHDFWMRLPMWATLACSVAVWVIARRARRSVDMARHLRRVAALASWAEWSVAAQVLQLLALALIRTPGSAWFVLALSLLYLTARLHGLVRQTAEELHAWADDIHLPSTAFPIPRL